MPKHRLDQLAFGDRAIRLDSAFLVVEQAGVLKRWTVEGCGGVNAADMSTDPNLPTECIMRSDDGHTYRGNGFLVRVAFVSAASATFEIRGAGALDGYCY